MFVQTPGFEVQTFPDRVIQSECRHFMNAFKLSEDWYENFVTYLLTMCSERKDRQDFVYRKRDKGLQVKQEENGIFISQNKYVTEILKKFSFTDVKTVSTPMETQKPLLKDEDSEEVDV
ncbi:hypothetical protein Tco_0817433 [Tanacetum coccineum]